MATARKIERDLRIFVRDNFTCRYCGWVGDTFEKWRYLTVDHFNPRASGGLADDENLVTACVDCNVIKAGRQFATFEEARAKMMEWLRLEQRDFERHFASSIRTSRSLSRTI